MKMDTKSLFGFRLMQQGEPKAAVLEAKLGNIKGDNKVPPSKPTTVAAPAVLQPKCGEKIG
ncbi:MAG: hypothetical protein O2981_10185 [Proteobacteria bacterium]|jgi:hypothetical protein|nr:hypothetical protein [Pseudomonadota bacterium]